MKDFRPLSNLSFLLKVIEKVIASWVTDHMAANDWMDPIQSGYREGHSTETALLRVHNDIISAVDKGNGAILILLDLSTAFDTVNHSILLNFHRAHVGVDGCALRLFESYLTEKAQCVSVDGVLSELSDLAYGVPQGYVL